MAERSDDVKFLLSVLAQVGEDASRFSPNFIEEVMNLTIRHLEFAYPLPPPRPPVCEGQTNITYYIQP